jgi:hypothetical protein
VKTSFFFGHKQFARSSGVHPHLVVLNQSGVINNYDLEDKTMSDPTNTQTIFANKISHIFDLIYKLHERSTRQLKNS